MMKIPTGALPVSLLAGGCWGLEAAATEPTEVLGEPAARDPAEVQETIVTRLLDQYKVLMLAASSVYGSANCPGSRGEDDRSIRPPRQGIFSSLRARFARRSAPRDATYDGAGPVPPRNERQ